jgi:hypothetical protein
VDSVSSTTLESGMTTPIHTLYRGDNAIESDGGVQDDELIVHAKVSRLESSQIFTHQRLASIANSIIKSSR